MLTLFISKARDCASEVAGDLRQAAKEADPVQHIVLLELIERAATLHNRIDGLLSAIEAND